MLDRFPPLIRDDDILEFANLGSYCEYDLFGIEVSHYQVYEMEKKTFPCDVEIRDSEKEIVISRTVRI